LSWAIVIGIDDYGGLLPNGDRLPTLQAAVHDAVRFSRFVVEEAGVPESHVRRLLGRRREGSRRRTSDLIPTKDNVVNVINEVMAESGGEGKALYFFFAGHGVTAMYANREESALVFPGIDDQQPVQTLAVRSITEFFETTLFLDQFFFIDACRSRLPASEAEIGAWPIPRRRLPGQDPAQQFILYATSPGRTAQDADWPEEHSAFTKVLMAGLKGKGQAKAWSWERGSYEVRWERLAGHVKHEMEKKQNPSNTEHYPFQIPQDVGIRGVAGRDRDAVLARPRPAQIKPLTLRLDLRGASGQAAKVTVLDALGVAVANAVGVTGRFQRFRLPPRTYAARIEIPDGRVGHFASPFELYENRDPPEIAWSDEDELEADEPYAPGQITIQTPDQLAVADVRDETGRVVGIATQNEGCETTPGFYRVRLVGPERDKTGDEALVQLRARKEAPADLPAPPVDEQTSALARAFGGSSTDGYVTPNAQAEPAAWARPSTVVASGIGAALHGDGTALRALGLKEPPAPGTEEACVLFVAARGTCDLQSLQRLQVRIWPLGQNISDDDIRALEPTEAGVAAVVKDVKTPERHWLSIEAPGEEPTVVALNPLKGRLAAVVAQVDQDRVRLYQFHPLAQPDDSSTPDRLRRLEHLERQLLGGRLDGARGIALGRPLDDEGIAARIDSQARRDPFGGCVVGYVLLRLGRYEWLGALATAIIEAAPAISDAYILRGEYEAHRQNEEASFQAFADAVSAGVPVFAEGLTRLVEGLLASRFLHPRGALVRYIFQRHARGSMWSAFTPRGEFKPGRLVITGSDIGYEG
jgi:Caspase domain